MLALDFSQEDLLPLPIPNEASLVYILWPTHMQSYLPGGGVRENLPTHTSMWCIKSRFVPRNLDWGFQGMKKGQTCVQKSWGQVGHESADGDEGAEPESRTSAHLL